MIFATIYVPKIGHCEIDSDDAFAIASVRDGSELRFAVSDGATSSSFSGLWATMLTQSFVCDPFLDDEGIVARRRIEAAKWKATIGGMALPWHARRQAACGAHATFAGAQVDLRNAPVWRAIAIGDTCVMHVRDGRVVKTFPYADGAAFDNYPKLLATSENYVDSKAAEEIAVATGDAFPGDVLLLATDAVAKFLLDRSDDGLSPIFRSLARIATDRSFLDATVDRLRHAGELANDDLTAVIVAFS